MKKILLTLAIVVTGYCSYAQNSPLNIWGAGLDGSTYQRASIYSDETYGLLLEAPLNPIGTRLPIEFNWRGSGVPPFKINPNGNVGIGTATPDSKLAVNGNIRAKEIKVEAANWPDYVFAKAYRLLPLMEIETFINQNHHLPGIPSATDIEENGLNLGEMNKLTIKKIEELTLHLIEKDRKEKELEAKIIKLQEQVEQLLRINKLSAKGSGN